MRKILVIGIFILSGVFSFSAFAQNDPEGIPGVTERSKFNFYGGLLAEPSFFDDKVGLSMGAIMGVSYIDHFYAGAYYLSLVSVHYRDNLPSWQGTDLRGSLNHGGLVLGYVLMPKKLMNVNFSARLGWGSVWFYDDKEGNPDILNDLYRGTRDKLLVLTPGVEYSLTPINWLRIGLGLGYRFAFMVDRYESNEFNSLVGTITISFGGFREDAMGEPDENEQP